MNHVWRIVPGVLLAARMAWGAATPSEAVILSSSGTVEVLEVETTTWMPAFPDQIMGEHDRIRTGPDSSAELSLDAGAHLRLEENTDLEVEELSADPDEPQGPVVAISFRQWVGNLLAKVEKFANPRSRFQVRTPTSVVAVRGTEFAVEVPSAEESRVGVFEGTVGVRHFEEANRPSVEETLVRENQQSLVRFRERPRAPFLLAERMLRHRERMLAIRERFAAARERWKALRERREERFHQRQERIRMRRELHQQQKGELRQERRQAHEQRLLERGKRREEKILHRQAELQQRLQEKRRELERRRPR